MIHAYDKIYLEKARLTLASLLDYAVNDCNYTLENAWNMFVNSSLGESFGKGNCSVVAGKSGIELWRDLSGIFIKVYFKSEKSEEYWLGWSIAYYQWYKNISFKDITIPIDELIELYFPYHEMDIMQFCDKMDELLGLNLGQSNLKRIRLKSGLTQKELSLRTNIPLRTIQQYEQKQKDINGARAEYVIMLSKVLYCRPDELLEY